MRAPMTDVRILQAADSALVIEFGSAIDREISGRVLGLAESVKAAELPGVTALTATSRSLSVSSASLVTTGAELELAVAALMKARPTDAQIRRLWQITACSD